MEAPVERLPQTAIDGAVSGILEATCGYARSTGKHQCGKNACDPATWADLKLTIQQVVTGLVWETLRQVVADGTGEAAAERAAYLAAELRWQCGQQAPVPRCRGCFDWMECEGRKNRRGV